MAGFNMDNYVTVDERIAEFRAMYPEGTLTSEILAYPTAEYPFIVVRALAWRHPEDPCPGMGHAAEIYPGRTPYTKDSELMNAETSAWGRAIVAVGAADTKRGIASRNEVANRKGASMGPNPTPSAPVPPGGPSPSGGTTTSPSPAGGQGPGSKGKGTGGSSREEAAPGACAHTDTSPLKMDGSALPAGKVRCIACGVVKKES